MTHTTRRTALTTTAWSVPAVLVASAAPAYATSEPTFECTPVGYKRPGLGQNTKDYFLQPSCPLQEVASVHIDGRRATPTISGWAIYDQPDSRRNLAVVVTLTDGRQWSGVVAFRPYPTGGAR